MSCSGLSSCDSRGRRSRARLVSGLAATRMAKDGMMTHGPGGRVFICYRREDAGYPAGWLFDQLTAHLGADRVFKDMDSIEPGDDFADVITEAVSSCAVLLAVIGPRWLAAAGPDERRLDDAGDFVRLEIEAALARGVRVIPVLCGVLEDQGTGDGGLLARRGGRGLGAHRDLSSIAVSPDIGLPII